MAAHKGSRIGTEAADRGKTLPNHGHNPCTSVERERERERESESESWINVSELKQTSNHIQIVDRTIVL
jgi:hypothetical protein